jgi:SNF2 family DNA or RNA helicase
MTASQLLTGGYDVAVTSYEFVEQSGRQKLAFPEAINAFSNDQEGRIPKPSRPTTALHSEVWEIVDIPFKRVILDEAHRVNKRNKVRHEAIKRLPARAFVMLSGTLPHNKWHNMSGYLDYLKGHAFDTHEKFLHTFGTRDDYGRPDNPSETQLRRLQIFLQAMLVARPQSILELKNCRCLSFKFQLRQSCNRTAEHYFTLYKEHIIRETWRKDSQGARTDGDEGLGAFLFLFYAQLASVHPMLLEEALAGRIELEDDDKDDPDDDIIAKPKGKGAGVDRDDWQRRLRERKQLCQESSRVIHFLRLFSWLRKNYPKRKIVVFSRLVVFLDIIAEALQRTFGIDALRFDGTVRPSKRSDVEREFKFTDESVPMLITSGVGKIGIPHLHISSRH